MRDPNKPSRMKRLLWEMKKQKSGAERSLATFAASSVSQNLTEQAKEAMSGHSSFNYAPTHSELYTDWLRSHGKGRLRWQWDRWFLLLCIGVCTGLVAVLLQQCLQALGAAKWERTKQYAKVDDFGTTFGWTACISCVFVLISSAFIVFVHPPAAGGGTPEVIAYLNGVVVHGVFGLRNLVTKFVSNVFAVSSGLPCAIQGPIIAFGATIGMGVGQFRSKTLGFTPSCFTRFRNAEDRRTFTTVGVAAGVAAAFNAPVGGLLFAMEDLSSFWSKEISWQVFLASIVAVAVAGMFNTAFNGFQYSGQFGLFSLSGCVQLTEPIQLHIALLVVAVVLGVIGGFLGAAFTRLNMQVVCKLRSKVLIRVRGALNRKFTRISETVILVLLMTLYYTVLPLDNRWCVELSVAQNETVHGQCITSIFSVSNKRVMNALEVFQCHQPTEGNITYYNELASIIQQGGTTQLQTLWSRGTHDLFSWQAMLTLFAIWFPMTAWTMGSAIAGGIFVPTLISGSLYGRAIGIATLSVYRYWVGETLGLPLGTDWDWIDPGLIATIGAGSLLGGVTRLGLASTVIVVEMAQDVNLFVPMFTTIFVAKMIADVLSKPLFKCQLEAKTLPYLDQEPDVIIDDTSVNLELFRVCDVMNSPVKTIRLTESLSEVASLLVNTHHDGFPVVKRCDDTGKEVMVGLITRQELLTILYTEEVYESRRSSIRIKPSSVKYDQISMDYLSNVTAAEERVHMYTKFDVYKGVEVDIEDFVNCSAPKIDADFSLHRTYQIFRTLGLRHLVVVDMYNQVVGMITRKDLMAFNIQERLQMLPGDDVFIDDPEWGTSSNVSRCSSYTDLATVTIQHESIPNLNNVNGCLNRLQDRQAAGTEDEEEEEEVDEADDGLDDKTIKIHRNIKNGRCQTNQYGTDSSDLIANYYNTESSDDGMCSGRDPISSNDSNESIAHQVMNDQIDGAASTAAGIVFAQSNPCSYSGRDTVINLELNLTKQTFVYNNPS